MDSVKRTINVLFYSISISGYIHIGQTSVSLSTLALLLGDLLRETNNVERSLSQRSNNLALTVGVDNLSLSHVSLNEKTSTSSQVVLEKVDQLLVKHRQVVPVSLAIFSLRVVSVDSQRVGKERNAILGFSGVDAADVTKQLHLGEVGASSRGGEGTGNGRSLGSQHGNWYYSVDGVCFNGFQLVSRAGW